MRRWMIFAFGLAGCDSLTNIQIDILVPAGLEPGTVVSEFNEEGDASINFKGLYEEGEVCDGAETTLRSELNDVGPCHYDVGVKLWFVVGRGCGAEESELVRPEGEPWASAVLLEGEACNSNEQKIELPLVDPG